MQRVEVNYADDSWFASYRFSYVIHHAAHDDLIKWIEKENAVRIIGDLIIKCVVMNDLIMDAGND